MKLRRHTPVQIIRKLRAGAEPLCLVELRGVNP